MQNDSDDALLRVYDYTGYAQISRAIESLPKDKRKYVLKRWFVWMASCCDEYLLSHLPGCTLNPNPKSHDYDVDFGGGLRLDVKGSKVLESMLGDVAAVLRCPQQMVDSFYRNQSEGVRHSYQDRLFLVHHSFLGHDRLDYLRSAWLSKPAIYARFFDNIGKVAFFPFQGCKAAVIFILEEQPGVVSSYIPGIDVCRW